MSELNKKIKGHFKEIIPKSQAPDAPEIKRLQQEIAVKHGPNGKRNWTTLKIYAQSPNFDHPFEIKFYTYNPGSGQCFFQMPPEEFKIFLNDLNNWWIENKDGIDECLRQDFIINRNREYFDRIKHILQSHKYSEPPKITISGIDVTEKSAQRERELICTMIDSLSPNLTKDKLKFLLSDISHRIGDLIQQDIDVTYIAEHLEHKVKELQIESIQLYTTIKDR